MTSRLSFIVLLFALLLTVISSARAASPETLPECRIGLVMPTTGQMAQYGAEGVIAARLALSHAKQSARHCRPVLTEQDSASQPTQANAAAATLLAPPKPVHIIVGEINSANTAAMVNPARAAQIPILAPTASMISLTSMSDRIFRIWPSDAYESKKMADYLLSNGIKRIAVLFLRVSYGEQMATSFKREFQAAGGTVNEQGYREDTRDFKPLLQRVSDHDAVYLISYVDDAASILKQALDIKAVTNHTFRFFGTSVLDTPKLIDKCGTAAEGVRFAVVEPGQEGDSTKRARFVSEYVSARKLSDSDPALRSAAKEPSFAGFHVYDAASLAFAAGDEVARTAELSGENLTKYLRDLPSYSGVTGQITFDQKGDLKAERRVSFKEIRSGRIQLLRER